MAGCSTERQGRRETTAGLNYMSGQGGKSSTGTDVCCCRRCLAACVAIGVQGPGLGEEIAELEDLACSEACRGV